MPTAVERSLAQTTPLSMTITGILNPVQILGFRFAVQSPRDAATGMASGKRQWKPVVVAMPWTKSSPQLYTFLHSSALLDEVTYQYDDDWISLSDAQIVNISPRSGGRMSVTFEYGGAEAGKGAAGRTLTDSMELERVAFTFQKIQVGSSGGGAAFKDDWTL